MKGIKCFLICLVTVFCQQLYSQEVEHTKNGSNGKQKLLPILCLGESRTNFMGNYLETNLFLGYVFKNNLSVGIPAQYVVFLDKTTHTYKEDFPIGIGLMYLPYRLEKNSGKAITVNPYANFLLYGESNDPGNYYKIDAGVNLVPPSFPNLFVGVGASYLTIEKDFGFFVSFGLQIP